MDKRKGISVSLESSKSKHVRQALFTQIDTNYSYPKFRRSSRPVLPEQSIPVTVLP